MKSTQFPQSLYSGGGTGGPVVITCATVPDNGSSNLVIKVARVMLVGELKPYTQTNFSKSKSQSGSRNRSMSQHQGGPGSFFFSFSIVDDTGVADAICWDGQRHPMLMSLLGQCVQLLGMSSKPMTEKDVRFSRGLGPNLLHCNYGPFSVNPLDGLFSTIPRDNEVPVDWLNTRERVQQVLMHRFGINTSQQQRQAPPTFAAETSDAELRQAMMLSLLPGAISPSPAKPQADSLATAASCCSDPNGPLCRVSGKPHPSRCMVCGFIIVPGEPFCSYSDPEAPGPCIPEPRGGMMRFRQSARKEPVKRARSKDDTEGEEDAFGKKGEGASKKS